jgi:protein-tyrosine phosphatase
MFRLFSKTKPTADTQVFRLLHTDIHSHLVPGIDDGAPDLAASLQLIRGMIALGYQKLITTPHILWDIYKNTRDMILSGFEKLQEAVEKEKLPVSLGIAAEYFLDDHVMGLLKRQEPLLTISGKKVLVEFSMAHHPLGLKDILFEMQMQGYQPVVAHPERYAYLERNKEFFDELKYMGCLFQCNILSLGNAYGKSVYELTQYLIKKKYYDMVGTDLHHPRHLEGLKNPEIARALQKMMAECTIINAEL